MAEEGGDMEKGNRKEERRLKSSCINGVVNRLRREVQGTETTKGTRGGTRGQKAGETQENSTIACAARGRGGGDERVVEKLGVKFERHSGEPCVQRTTREKGGKSNLRSLQK